jgi:mRNA interferase RelE/StbE
MNYTVELSPRAAKSFRALPREAQRHVQEHIDDLAKNPRPHGYIKLKGVEDAYRIRSGKYRIIYEIHDGRLVVLVLGIAHRKDVYRRY